MVEGVTPFGPRSLVVRAQFAGSGGYSENARNIVRGLLDEGVEVQAIETYDAPVSEWAPWLAPLARPVASPVVLDVDSPILIAPSPGSRVVNYSMFEGSRLPRWWAAHIRQTAATIVPSRHSWELWRAIGYPAERLRIVRHGIDTRRFDGSAPPWIPSPLPDGSPFASRRVRMGAVVDVRPRKNIAGLLTAWLRATTAGDDAALLVRAAGVGAEVEAELAREIASAERAAGKLLASAAPVVWQRAPLPSSAMPGLYTACTHYVSASRGEGWDMPMTEAGASGLTLIAPAHTGYLAYLDDRVATLVPARRQRATVHPHDVGADEWRGIDWYEPDLEALAAAIRAAIDGRPLVTGAQERIRGAFDVRHAAIELLDALASLFPEEIARGW